MKKWLRYITSSKTKRYIGPTNGMVTSEKLAQGNVGPHPSICSNASRVNFLPVNNLPLEYYIAVEAIIC